MKKVLVALMLICSLTAAGFAAVGTTSVSVLGGYAIPAGGDWGNTNTGYKGSFALAGGGDYQFHDMLAAGVEGGYNFKHENQAVSSIEIKMWYVTPYLKILHKQDIITFFGIIGAGIYGFNSDNNVFKDANNSITAFGFNVGGGVMFDVAENIQAGIDARWHHAVKVLANDKSINNIVPAARFSFFFE
jgi:opacity protein-like surface antigen